jgi:hypothetical protein
MVTHLCGPHPANAARVPQARRLNWRVLDKAKHFVLALPTFGTDKQGMHVCEEDPIFR